MTTYIHNCEIEQISPRIFHVRPRGVLGTCGWIHGVPWSLERINAKSALSAYLKSDIAVKFPPFEEGAYYFNGKTFLKYTGRGEMVDVMSTSYFPVECKDPILPRVREVTTKSFVFLRMGGLTAVRHKDYRVFNKVSHELLEDCLDDLEAKRWKQA